MSCNLTAILSQYGVRGFNTTILTQVQAQVSHCPNLGVNVTDGDFRIFVYVASAIAGGRFKFTPYPSEAVIKRLWNWKVPILQLITQFPASPHDFWFTFFHFLGDPGDTLGSLVHTLAVASTTYRTLMKRGLNPRQARSKALIDIEIKRVVNRQRVEETEK
jgi:hypothetical protein